MSDYQSETDLQKYLERLLDRSKPNSNDKRHCDYVRYINGFLRFFGKERVYLVGSTAEQTKLRIDFQDNGDADFILVSGRLAVQVSQIEPRTDNPSYVWIRGENLDSDQKLNIDMITTDDGKKYLPAKILHELDVRLFTILRGIYKCVTTTTDSVPARQTRVTTFGERSNVGLARTEFRGLEIKDKHKIPQLRKYFPKHLRPRESNVKSQKRDKDSEDIRKILQLIAVFHTPGNPTEPEGQFAHFTDVVKLVLDRQKNENEKQREKEPIVDFDDSVSDNLTHCSGETNLNTTNEEHEVFVNDLDLPTDVQATYKEKTMKDFVPALRLEGKPECLDKWLKENGKWLSDEVKWKIYNSELYVVAKDAPEGPNERDFCLSFNRAEIELAKALTKTQRTCLLMLKAYYKGILGNIMKTHNDRHRLKSFHIKTALYWVLEEPASCQSAQLWREENLIKAVGTVLKFLKEALLKKTLQHYFTKSNLFAGMETELCKSLADGIDQILATPVKCLEDFFELEKKTDNEIILTDEQINCLIEMSRDGGVEEEANILEDLLEDFNRGFKEAPKDENGNSPLQKAMSHIFSLYVQDEQRKFFESLVGFASVSTQQASSSSLDVGLQSFNSEDLSESMARPLLSSHQSSREDQQSNDHQETQKTEQTFDHLRQLEGAFNAFFDDTVSGDEPQSVEGELKQLGLSYFSGN